MVNCSRWWQVPYYWVGIKMYDVVAGSKTLKNSYYLSKKNALELFPMLKGNALCGGIVYYDGKQFRYFFFGPSADFLIRSTG